MARNGGEGTIPTGGDGPTWDTAMLDNIYAKSQIGPKDQQTAPVSGARIHHQHGAEPPGDRGTRLFNEQEPYLLSLSGTF